MADPFAGRFWKSFRALWPSWRFFENLDWVPLLSFRLVSATSDAVHADWVPCFPSAPPRGALAPFWNPRGNLRMAAHSVIERLVAEIAEIPDGADASVRDSVSYELTTRLVRDRLRDLGVAGGSFQFRIVSAIPGPRESALSDAEELFLSAVHEI